MREPLLQTLLINAAGGALAALIGGAALLACDAWGLRDLLMADPDRAILLPALALQGVALLGGGAAATSVFALGEGE